MSIYEPSEGNRYWVGALAEVLAHDQPKTLPNPCVMFIEVRRLSRFQWRIIDRHGPGTWYGKRKLEAECKAGWYFFPCPDDWVTKMRDPKPGTEGQLRST